MLRLVQRAARHEEQTALISFVPASRGLGDVRADRVGSPHELKTYGPAREGGPTGHALMDVVGKVDRDAIRGQIAECAGHTSPKLTGGESRPSAHCPLP